MQSNVLYSDGKVAVLLARPLHFTTGLLGMLDEYPDLLIVVNHPFWDEKGIGLSNHAQVFNRLLERYGRYFHALELNGLRSWTENKQVLALGTQTTPRCGLPWMIAPESGSHPDWPIGDLPLLSSLLHERGGP